MKEDSNRQTEIKNAVGDKELQEKIFAELVEIQAAQRKEYTE